MHRFAALLVLALSFLIAPLARAQLDRRHVGDNRRCHCSACFSTSLLRVWEPQPWKPWTVLLDLGPSGFSRGGPQPNGLRAALSTGSVLKQKKQARGAG